MSTSAILDRAEAYRDLTAEISRLEGEIERVAADPIAQLATLRTEVNRVKGELLAMLAAAKDHTFELDGGWKFKRLTNTTTTYAIEAAKAKWRPSILRRCMVRTVDNKLVDAEVEAGRLSVLDARAAESKSDSAPYLRVTQPKKQKA